MPGRADVTQFVLIVAGAMVVALVGAFGFFLAPMIYDGFHSAHQQRSLQRRSDYQQIAAACVLLARAKTNASAMVKPSDPMVPAVLSQLAPRYIGAYSNLVTLEFHGGFDHYGYRVEQSEEDARIWRISYYTEKERRVLATITNE